MSGPAQSNIIYNYASHPLGAYHEIGILHKASLNVTMLNVTFLRKVSVTVTPHRIWDVAQWQGPAWQAGSSGFNPQYCRRGKGEGEENMWGSCSVYKMEGPTVLLLFHFRHFKGENPLKIWYFLKVIRKGLSLGYLTLHDIQWASLGISHFEKNYYKMTGEICGPSSALPKNVPWCLHPSSHISRELNVLVWAFIERDWGRDRGCWDASWVFSVNPQFTVSAHRAALAAGPCGLWNSSTEASAKLTIFWLVLNVSITWLAGTFRLTWIWKT